MDTQGHWVSGPEGHPCRTRGRGGGGRGKDTPSEGLRVPTTQHLLRHGPSGIINVFVTDRQTDPCWQRRLPR